MFDSPLNAQLLLAEGAAPGRACGECTACCTVLAEVELRKPMRCACVHQRQSGCSIYDARPRACRDFHCLWLRGALPAEVAYRPDRLGVLFDAYRPAGAADVRLAALEVWNGAFEEPLSASLIDAIASTRPVELSRRDGAWSTRAPD